MNAQQCLFVRTDSVAVEEDIMPEWRQGCYNDGGEMFFIFFAMIVPMSRK